MKGGLLQDGDDVAHMRGERTEALLDTLFVPDVREDIVEYGKLGALKGRDMEPGLSHEGKKPHCFQRDGLSSGVGSGNDQQIKIISQADADRNDFLRVQQGVTAVLNADPPLVVEDRSGGVHVSGQRGFGEDKIQADQQFVIFGDQFHGLSRGFA